jgi:hypothetical protein
MVAELPSEVLDVETPFGGARNIVPHLMKGEARLNFVLQRDDVILTRLHGPAAARALENHVRLIGHVTDVIPLPSDPAQGFSRRPVSSRRSDRDASATKCTERWRPRPATRLTLACTIAAREPSTSEAPYSVRPGHYYVSSTSLTTVS